MVDLAPECIREAHKVLKEFLYDPRPVGITAYPGTGKATVVTISPLTQSIIDSNGGGYFGPYPCAGSISYYDPRREEVRIKQAARGGAGVAR